MPGQNGQGLWKNRATLLFFEPGADPAIAPGTEPGEDEPLSSVHLGGRGPAEIATSLAEGSYDVYVATQFDTTGMPLPLGAEVLAREDWQARESLNVDLGLHTLSGTVDLSGVEGGDARGSVVAVRSGNDRWQSVSDLSASGDDSFELQVFPGTYDLYWNPRGRYLSQDSAPLLAGNVRVSGDMEMDVAATETPVDVLVTVDGQPVPDNSFDNSRARLELSANGVRTTIQLGSTGSAAYVGPVPNGEYDVFLLTGLEDYQDALPADQDLPVKEGWRPAEEPQLSIDVQTTRVTGRVLLDGEALPNLEEGSRGRLVFAETGGGSYPDSGGPSVDLGAEGEGEFELSVMEGPTYDVYIETSLIDNGAEYPVTALLKEGFDPVSGEALDLNLQTVDVEGEVTVGGEAMPDPTIRTEFPEVPRATLRFKRVDHPVFFGVPAREIELPRLGPATFSAELAEGVYRVSLVPGGSHEQDVLPTSSFVLREEWNPATNSHSFDLPEIVELHGNAFVNQRARLPAGVTSESPSVHFHRADGRVSLAPFDHMPASDDGYRFRTRLYAGEYRVEFRYYDEDASQVVRLGRSEICTRTE